jgi:hypothetical protein
MGSMYIRVLAAAETVLGLALVTVRSEMLRVMTRGRRKS